MAVLTHLETDTGTNVDISSATAVGAYTANADKLIMVDVSIDAVAGNGDYVMYVTRQIGGAGSAYRILPQTTLTAASGLTAISAQSGWITVRNGDVLTCYVDGLAGDTTTPDWTTRWFELAGVTAAAVADAVWDEATADHTTATSFGSLDANIDAILADTGTDGVVLKAAGLADDAVNEIVDQVWNEAIADHTTATTFGGKNQKVVPSETINDYKADVSALTNVTLAATQTGVTIPTVTTLTNLPAVSTDWLTAAGVKADAVTKIQTGLATPTNITAGTITTVTNLTNAPTNGDLTATMKTSVTTAASSATPALSATGVDAILDEVVVGSYTLRQLVKVMAAAMAGKATGGGTTTVTFRGVDDTSNVIVATVDANGNRSAVTLTV